MVFNSDGCSMRNKGGGACLSGAVHAGFEMPFRIPSICFVDEMKVVFDFLGC